MLGVFNADPAAAVESFRRLAQLDAELACFGDGEPVRTEAGARLREAAPGDAVSHAARYAAN
jgi:hypothetical protein